LRVAAVEEWSTQVKEVRCECDEGEGLSIGPPPIFKGVEAGALLGRWGLDDSEDHETKTIGAE
jgi:hypothetical protein